MTRIPAPAEEVLFDHEHRDDLKLYHSGKTLRDVADTFGISLQTVSNKLREAGVKRRRGGNDSKVTKKAILAALKSARTWGDPNRNTHGKTIGMIVQKQPLHLATITALRVLPKRPAVGVSATTKPIQSVRGPGLGQQAIRRDAPNSPF